MSFGIPVRNGLSVGLLASTFLTSGSGRLVPRLTLNFLTGAPLDSRITFSRTTNATLVDSTGRVTYAPNNLLLRSEEFDNASWTKTASTITPNAAAAPNGAFIADKLVENTAVTTGHYVNVGGPLVAVGQAYVLSVYAKAGERTFLQLIVTGPAPAGGNFIAGFDLTNGTAGTPSATATSTITDVGDGWYRCSIAFPISSGTSAGLQIRLALNSVAVASSYTGDGTSGLFIWGAQFEQVTYQTLPSTYVQTVASAYYGPRFDYNPATLAPRGLLIEEQRVNLVLYSEQFDNAATWVRTTANLTANATTSPDGTTNADRLTADGTPSTHNINQSLTFTAAAHTVSVYAKKDTNNFVQIRIGAFAIAGGTGFANFDLNAGTVGTVGAGLSAASITPAGNGWFRCTITGTTLAAVSGIGLYVVASATSISAEINTLTTSVFLYGAQVEAGGFATSYIPTVASTVTRAADIASMTGTNFSSWYNASEGTIVAQATAYGNKASSVLVRIQDATAVTNFIAGRQSATGTQILGQTSSSGGLTAGLAATNFTLGVPFVIAVACAPSNIAASVNGGTVGTSTAMTTMPVVDRLNISEGGPFYVRSITYYPSRLTNAQLQALTT